LDDVPRIAWIAYAARSAVAVVEGEEGLDIEAQRPAVVLRGAVIHAHGEAGAADAAP
jgi:hypothetical protein